MNSRNALAIVEQEYGSLDELAYVILDQKQEALDESLSLTERAAAVNLPLTVFARVLSSPIFRAMVRADMVNNVYDFTAEEHHIRHMSKVAAGDSRKVVTAKGDIAFVDQAPTDVIAAGRYLNEMRGTPVETRTAAAGGITINIQQVRPEEDRAEVLDAQVVVHQPRHAGELPSSAVPGGSATPDAVPLLPGKGLDADFGAFYGESAAEADVDSQTAEKRGEEREPRPGAWNPPKDRFRRRNTRFLRNALNPRRGDV